MVELNLTNLPFELSGRTFNELSDRETNFFSFDDEYLPLPLNHALQIILLDKKSFSNVRSLAMSRLWNDSIHDFRRFPCIEKKPLHDKWNSESGIQEVRQWLYSLGMSFSQNIFLLYSDRIILTSWKILVKYWDAFAWSVGFAMYAFDTSMNWICEFNHEDTIAYSAFN